MPDKYRPTELASVILALLIFVLSSVEGEIRCYCNQASCVSTGYMCKSSVCFGDPDSGLHGCLAQEEVGRRCAAGLMHCCREDMCNYMVHVDRPPSTGHLDDPADSSRSLAVLESSLRREIWFKAAVIATPIAGLCILALLAAAAHRMLRQDAERQRRLLEIRRTLYGGGRPLLLPWHREKGTVV